MTCAGISSLVITGLKRVQGLEFLQGENIENCGKGGIAPSLQRGIDWMANHFQVGQNYGNGQQWKLYYLYGLERAGRLGGLRFFGRHDWYRLGAEELVHEQNKLSGFWQAHWLRATRRSPPALRSCFWPRAMPGVGQQTAAWPARRLEQ